MNDCCQFKEAERITFSMLQQGFQFLWNGTENEHLNSPEKNPGKLEFHKEITILKYPFWIAKLQGFQEIQIDIHNYTSTPNY